MPMYDCVCKKCKKKFEELCSVSEMDNIKCPKCKSKAQTLMPVSLAVIFKEPKGTSREDNFEYVAKWNMDNAKEIRRRAEQEAADTAPYGWDEHADFNSDANFGEVK